MIYGYDVPYCDLPYCNNRKNKTTWKKCMRNKVIINRQNKIGKILDLLGGKIGIVDFLWGRGGGVVCFHARKMKNHVDVKDVKDFVTKGMFTL